MLREMGTIYRTTVRQWQMEMKELNAKESTSEGRRERSHLRWRFNLVHRNCGGCRGMGLHRGFDRGLLAGRGRSSGGRIPRLNNSRRRTFGGAEHGRQQARGPTVKNLQRRLRGEPAQRGATQPSGFPHMSNGLCSNPHPELLRQLVGVAGAHTKNVQQAGSRWPFLTCENAN